MLSKSIHFFNSIQPNSERTLSPPPVLTSGEKLVLVGVSAPSQLQRRQGATRHRQLTTEPYSPWRWASLLPDGWTSSHLCRHGNWLPGPGPSIMQEPRPVVAPDWPYSGHMSTLWTAAGEREELLPFSSTAWL